MEKVSFIKEKENYLLLKLTKNIKLILKEKKISLKQWIIKLGVKTKDVSLVCFSVFMMGVNLGSTGAESEWRQTGWFRKNQIKVRANNYVAPKTYALAA